MNKQELIESIAHLPSDCSGLLPMINKLAVLEFIKLLDEPQKVTVPQFVADWIEEAKKEYYSILGAINEAPKGEVEEWIELQNVETFAEAWVNGYHIEKEKRYTVKLKNKAGNEDYLVKTSNNELRFYNNIYTKNRVHTRKELEEAGFGWVFDCPGMEVDEVKR